MLVATGSGVGGRTSLGDHHRGRGGAALARVGLFINAVVDMVVVPAMYVRRSR